MPRRSSIASSLSKSKSRSTGAGEGSRVLHLDAFSGMAGNMFMGAMLDLGLLRRELESDLAGLGLDFKLRVSRVRRGALAARHVRVQVPARARAARERGRHVKEIEGLLGRAALRDSVRKRALAIFRALAEAEGRVHGLAPERVHFHEVGAIDAMVDVTAAAIALDRLGIERVSCSEIGLGHGFVETEHGRLPLPAPATLELVRGMPTHPAGVEAETLTPTGAAILRCVVDEFGAMPAMRVEAVGHGAGEDREGPLPNVVRAVLGRVPAAGPGGLARDRVIALETNLDDLVPEHFDYVMERLFETGALDVSIQHVQMKKNRPGFLLRVLGRPADRLALAAVLFAESTALGVRVQEWDRLLLDRTSKRVSTAYGRIRVKCARTPEGGVEVSAEYDDCKRAARRSGAALREVVRSAEAAARELVRREKP